MKTNRNHFNQASCPNPICCGRNKAPKTAPMYPYLKIAFIACFLSVTANGFSQTGKEGLPPLSESTLPVHVDVEPDALTPPDASMPVDHHVHAATENPDTHFSDTASTQAYHDALAAYYKSIEAKNLANARTVDSVGSYYVWALKNRESVIERQQVKGSVIFALVVLLVLAGLAFSAIQFRIALKSVKRKNAPAPELTSFKASLAGIEVSSSILGIVILTLSLAFFYLYLTNVYPLVSLDQLPTQVPGNN